MNEFEITQIFFSNSSCVQNATWHSLDFKIGLSLGHSSS
jgi:hypothetical protein